MDIDCCNGGTSTLAPGDAFYFVNYQSQEITITNACPPLAAMVYEVPAAANGTPGRCPAEIAAGCSARQLYPVNKWLPRASAPQSRDQGFRLSAEDHREGAELKRPAARRPTRRVLYSVQKGQLVLRVKRNTISVSLPFCLHVQRSVM